LLETGHFALKEDAGTAAGFLGAFLERPSARKKIN
jgi:hypothetical protein